MTPLLSIIIVNYNYQNYILDAISSALNQSFNNIEVIVVDHASTDNSHNVINDYITKNKLRHKVRYIRTSKNYGGPSYPRNLGIESSHGTYVLCLDGDDMINECFAEEGLGLIEKRSADILVPRIKHFGICDNVEDSCNYDKDLIYFENILPYCCIIKRSAWEKCGKYKEDLLILEDWEFFLSAAKNSLKIAQINKPYFLYRKHGNSVWDQTFSNEGRIQDEIIGIKKYHPEFPITKKKDILHFLGSHYYYQTQQYNRLNQVLCAKVFQSIKDNEQNNRKILWLIDKLIHDENNIYN